IVRACDNFEDEHRHLSCQVIEIPFRRYASERKESLLQIMRVMKSGKHLSNSGNEPGITGTLPGKSGEVVFDTGKQVGKTGKLLFATGDLLFMCVNQLSKPKENENGQKNHD